MKTATLFLLAGLSVATLTAGPALPFDSPPSVVKTVKADKPATATGAGYVSLLVTVQPDGTVAETKVLKCTHPELEAPAREAMMQYRFQPALKNGKPIEAKVVQTVRFS